MIPKGFSFSAANADIDGTSSPKNDIGLLYCNTKASLCGVFTRNRVKAAPVLIGMDLVKRGVVRAVLANSGNANACTGEAGLDDARRLMAAVASRLKIDADEVIPLSTGVIGVRLPVDKMLSKLDTLARGLGDNVDTFARSMMTTDTFPKIASRRVGQACILGVAKGSGMIAPDMATTLAIVITDAIMERGELERTIKDAVKTTFNAITVDGDTSTNDTLIALSSNMLHAELEGVEKAIFEVIQELSMMVVRDGEGASKVVRINVSGCDTDEEARKVGKTVGNSLLVKTALYGSDPNWGRIMAAIGYSGVDIDTGSVSIHISGHPVVEGGVEAGGYKEEDVRSALEGKDIHIDISVGSGSGSFTIWTTDLTHKYVDINAEYRS
ncbi:MAG: bifunctional glutamate N-acetyltransferase/amino-acid acetyltransferase ArgJ [Deltaproteobacteria bacterium]|nr:bifunctional glutamate N-acetyltransferase/amino-acid acetyltransferase ArgJ [Deltaproteobacteria bacterium]